jgi:16S rRNA (guanine527-N7)-methyltransferase
MEEELIRILTEEAAGLGIILGPREQTRFSLFYDEFQKWNAKMNLTSLGPGPSFVIKHFIDSLLALSLIPQAAKSLLDLGTGGGFPGIPLRIVRNNLDVTLLDSSRKKTSFLRQVILLLGLSDTRVITGRAEELIRQGTGQGEYDVVISRATFKLSQILELGSHFLNREGMIIALKGRDLQEEMEETEAVILKHHLRLVEKKEETLPRYGDIRTLLIYKQD